MRLGVVGLGRLWEQQKPALVRRRDRFQVTAIYDQVARRAEIEAGPLGCRAVHGLVALMISPDVDAIAWLAPQWFGIHPLSQAAEAGKPIYCGLTLPADPAELRHLAALLNTNPHPRIFWPADLVTNQDDPLDQFYRLVQGQGPAATEWQAVHEGLRARVHHRFDLPGEPSAGRG